MVIPAIWCLIFQLHRYFLLFNYWKVWHGTYCRDDLWHYDRVLSLQQVLLCLSTLRWRLAGKAASFIFRRNLHVPPELMCLKQNNVLILISLPQMKNLGMSIELDPKGDKITCPAFCCTFLQLNILLCDILFWIWRVFRTSQNRVIGPLTKETLDFCTER